MDTASLPKLLFDAGLSTDLTSIIGRRVRFAPREAMRVIKTDMATVEMEIGPSERTVRGIELAEDGLRLLLVPNAKQDENEIWSPAAFFFRPILWLIGFPGKAAFDPYLAHAGGAWHLVMSTPTDAETPLFIDGTLAIL